jgi:isopenicillin N synthase-like dioxygenase
MSFTAVPVLDLSAARDPATKPAFLTELRHALMEVGFLYLKNVGIPEKLFQDVITQGKAFFDVSLDEK